MLYVCVRGVMDVMLYCDASSCRCSCMGSMSVSSGVCSSYIVSLCDFAYYVFG